MDTVGDPDDAAASHWRDSDLEQANSAPTDRHDNVCDLLAAILAIAELATIETAIVKWKGCVDRDACCRAKSYFT